MILKCPDCLASLRVHSVKTLKCNGCGELFDRHFLEHINSKDLIVPKCLVCGKLMYIVKDSMTKTYTGYLWRCECMPKNIILSVG